MSLGHILLLIPQSSVRPRVTSKKHSLLPIIWCNLKPLEAWPSLCTLGICHSRQMSTVPVSSAPRTGLGTEQAQWELTKQLVVVDFKQEQHVAAITLFLSQLGWG